eukprot:10194623-Alexandrium_andersonii.AAC.1
MLREELSGMLPEPEHDRMVDCNPPLDSLLQREHKGADQPFQLPRSILDGPIRLGLVRRRRLEH